MNTNLRLSEKSNLYKTLLQDPTFEALPECNKNKKKTVINLTMKKNTKTSLKRWISADKAM